MFKKFKAIICVILAVTSLSSCGKYAKLYETLDNMTLETVFPEIESSVASISDAKEYTLIQQKALSEAMVEAYKITDIETLREKHPDINRDKMMAELSNKRVLLNNDSIIAFRDNINILLEGVDEQDRISYIQKCVKEVEDFYLDYDKITDPDNDNHKVISKIFTTYAFSKNEFAKYIIIENAEKITKAATLTIEENAEEETSLRANITKNNQIIRAINEVFGGVNSDESYKTRINNANRKLLTKTLNSMSGMSQAEKDNILSQFEET